MTVCTKIIRGTDYSIDEVLDFIQFDKAQYIALDTETMNKNLAEYLTLFEYNPNSYLTTDFLWNKFRAGGSALIKHFSEMYEREKGEALPKDFNKTNFKQLLKTELWNVSAEGKRSKSSVGKWVDAASDLSKVDITCVQFGTYDKKNDRYNIVILPQLAESKEKTLEVIKALDSKPFVIQNASFDLRAIGHYFNYFINSMCVDTRINEILILGGKTDRSTSLHELCQHYDIDNSLSKVEENPLQVDWARTTKQVHIDYATQDVTAVIAILEKQLKILSQDGLLRAANLEAKIAPKLAKASVLGIAIDTETVENKLQELEEKGPIFKSKLPSDFPKITKKQEVLKYINDKFNTSLTSVDKDDFYSCVDNLNNKELKELFDVVIEYSSWSSQKSHWEKLGGQKLFRTEYLSAVSASKHDWQNKDGGASTGRIMSRPSIQTIPKSRRHVYQPFSKDYVFLDADYNAIQFWITAEMCQDPTMLSLYTEDIDPHSYMASKIYDKTMEEIEEEAKSNPYGMRFTAKMANFGFIFHLWHTSFAKKLLISTKGKINLSDEEAKKIRDDFFSNYKTLGQWQDNMHKIAAIKGYTETLGGRRRYWDEEAYHRNLKWSKEKWGYAPRPKAFTYKGVIYDDLKQMQRYSDKDYRNLSVNTPVQGTEADIAKEALNLLPNWLIPSIIVHDQLCVACPKDRAEEGKVALNKAMEDAGRKYIKKAKVLAEVKVKQNWKN